MNISKIVYWLAVACLGYYTVRSVIIGDSGMIAGRVLAVVLWSFLTWMLFRRPKSWGLGVGIFMLLTVAIQLGLWRLAVTSPKKEELGLDDSLLSFAWSVTPLFIGGLSSISLRWLAPEQPIQGTTDNSGAAPRRV
jgi:hypothetical protein